MGVFAFNDEIFNDDVFHEDEVLNIDPAQELFGDNDTGADFDGDEIQVEVVEVEEGETQVTTEAASGGIEHDFIAAAQDVTTTVPLKVWESDSILKKLALLFSQTAAYASLYFTAPAVATAEAMKKLGATLNKPKPSLLKKILQTLSSRKTVYGGLFLTVGGTLFYLSKQVVATVTSTPVDRDAIAKVFENPQICWDDKAWVQNVLTRPLAYAMQLALQKAVSPHVAACSFMPVVTLVPAKPEETQSALDIMIQTLTAFKTKVDLYLLTHAATATKVAVAAGAGGAAVLTAAIIYKLYKQAQERKLAEKIKEAQNMLVNRIARTVTKPLGLLSGIMVGLFKKIPVLAAIVALPMALVGAIFGVFAWAIGLLTGTAKEYSRLSAVAINTMVDIIKNFPRALIGTVKNFLNFAKEVITGAKGKAKSEKLNEAIEELEANELFGLPVLEAEGEEEDKGLMKLAKEAFELVAKSVQKAIGGIAKGVGAVVGGATGLIMFLGLHAKKIALGILGKKPEKSAVKIPKSAISKPFALMAKLPVFGSVVAEFVNGVKTGFNRVIKHLGIRGFTTVKGTLVVVLA